jgi:hypothetical protein
MTDLSSLTTTETAHVDIDHGVLPLETTAANNTAIVNYHIDFVTHMNDVVDYLNAEASKQQELLNLVGGLHTKLSLLKDTLNLKPVVSEVQTVVAAVEKKVSWLEHLFSDFRKKK